MRKFAVTAPALKPVPTAITPWNNAVGYADLTSAYASIFRDEQIYRSTVRLNTSTSTE